MIETRTFILSEIRDLSMCALVAAGTSESNASHLVEATAAAEADGVANHGPGLCPDQL